MITMKKFTVLCILGVVVTSLVGSQVFVTLLEPDLAMGLSFLWGMLCGFVGQLVWITKAPA